MPASQQGDAERVASLSDKQRDSLRLTYLHKTSKEIAIMRGVTPFAIDAQIDRARKQLGVSSRIEAAELVMRHAPGPYERPIYGSPAIAELAEVGAEMPSPDEAADSTGMAIAEAPSRYLPPSSDLTERSAPGNWGRPDDLKPITRALLIPAAAFLILCIVFTLLAVGDQASKWAHKALPAYDKPQ